jgi:acetyl-CoA carboxylase, biotin carboxylase subunit
MIFRKILIANRGEIALRVICACKELGISTVAVYSEADRNSLHVRFADEAVCIGPARSAQSYLNIPHVISAAEITDVDAIHPGYGFLSENANFAEVCEASHITFIGPSPDLLRLMGEKEQARREMAAAGVPILPGSQGILSDADAADADAERIGYPVIIKASAGGGGRGMRVVRRSEELTAAWETARNEAQQAFGVPDVYLEKFIEHPRHIEFQVLGDRHGSVMHLGERECSIQRRHQKLVEESPSPVMDAKRRQELGGKVVRALKKVGYTNAGTVEFLMDEDGSFYFIEMNARVQVEHPVTEMVTNVDLIKAQIRIAAGEKLEEATGPVNFHGHSIECRINAEDPETFVPSAGRITAFQMPGGTGVRVDTAAHADAVISPYYDSLIAKLIVRGRDRAEAIARMRRALEMFVIEGIKTSLPLHQRIFADPDFTAGKFDTHFLERLGMVPSK